MNVTSAQELFAFTNSGWALLESSYFIVNNYNHGRNIFRLFDTLWKFLFTLSETKRDY